ncbi:MAG: hypothetical protein PQJ61_17675 [Spirochaetales bacterium]|uniref:Uncharacterized protein n=1 Tax=Candidatus Thalassospirochaeta sargassi TaxID=3119039 RepID=A0AAJ1IKD7_9SPIO|nr:hypothetical protein [Spirochaetales bacterium]
MSVSPLDLQTLYSNLKIVGQQQASERGAEIAQQDKQAEESARAADEKDHKVGETKDVETGTEKINEDEQNKREGKSGKEQEKPEEKEEEKVEKNYFEDPDIGHNIDISG